MALNSFDLFDVRSLLTDEERAVQDTVARFTDERVIPIIGDAFDQGRFPQELVAEIAELGLLGSSLPEQYGGGGLNAVSYGLICQELERGDSGIRSFVSVQSSLCMYPIHAFGSEEQRLRWLPDMAAGKVIGCFGLTEPHGGSDPANMKTRAVRDGDDWLVTGSMRTDSKPGSRIALGEGSRTVGSDVTYRLDGRRHNVRMDQQPGPRLPVIDGQVVTQVASVADSSNG